MPANKKIDGLVGGMFVGLEAEAADLFFLKVIRNLLTHSYCGLVRVVNKCSVVKDTLLFYKEQAGTPWQQKLNGLLWSI